MLGCKDLPAMCTDYFPKLARHNGRPWIPLELNFPCSKTARQQKYISLTTNERLRRLYLQEPVRLLGVLLRSTEDQKLLDESGLVHLKYLQKHLEKIYTIIPLEYITFEKVTLQASHFFDERQAKENSIFAPLVNKTSRLHSVSCTYIVG